MTTKNFKVKNGIDIGNVADAIKVSGGVLQTKGGNIQVGITGANEIDTSSGNLTIDSAGGTVTVDDNFQIGSGASVSTILDEDNMATDSDTALATQQSIKAYVDTELSGLSQNSISQNNTNITVTDSGSNGTITFTADGNSELVINDTSATFSGNVQVDGNLNVSGTTTTVNTTNVLISDPIQVLSATNSGGADVDSGIMIERGSAGNNAVFYWNEGDDKFKAVTSTSGHDATAITDSATATIVANLEGTATAAQYSDLAERFASDTPYAPGTVVALGGAEEITATQEERSERVFGVVSGTHQAAFKMNGGAGTDETHPLIALAGRVQVKVLGTVSKGDRLVTSAVSGVARKAQADECTAFNVIGRALEDKHTQGLGEVLCFVTAKS